MRFFAKPILSTFALVLLAGLIPGAQSQAQTVYVSGCAAGPGDGSPSNPYKTLTRAVEQTPPGSTLVVQGGSYPERLTIQKRLTITASGGPVQIGQYFVGTQEICVPITDRSCGSFENQNLVNCGGDPPSVHAKLYYPAVGPGNAPMACGGPFPLIIYAHGKRLCPLLCDWSHPGPIQEDYRQAEGLLAPLAALGFIVVSVDVTWSLTTTLGKAMIILNTLAFVRDENRRAGSLLKGAVNLTRVALAGHSTGATAAVEAVRNLRMNLCGRNLGLDGIRIAALALLAPGLYTDPINAPVLVMYGTEDKQQVGDDPLRQYGSASPPKHLVIISGANHYGYTDGICVAPSGCESGDNPSQVGGVTGPEAHRRQQQAAGDYLEAFFSAYLLGDRSQLIYLFQQGEEQCGNPGNPPACGTPARRFGDLDALNVAVSVCSCFP
jgi:dienelactone hydrolase